VSAPPAAAEAVEELAPGATDAERRADRRVLRRRATLPYLLLAPGIIWLVAFFIVPMWSIVSTSVETGSTDTGFELSWRWANFGDVWHNWKEQIIRSLEYSVMCTVFCLLLALPLAYFIAFKAGRWKNLLMALVVAPFFTSYLIRTLAWKTILADDGWVVSALGSVGLLPSDGRLLSTSWAVIGGLIYNWIIFMILPLYVSLEKIDPRLIEATKDLYSSNTRSFTKVIMPLSMPGVFAGSLLVFIPAAGDFINASYLGSTQTTMIGNVIQQQFLVVKDYPAAAALSMVLMVIILVGVLAYTRALGTEDLV